MNLEELIENLVFSATWPVAEPADVKRELTALAAHRMARNRLLDRYGALGFQILWSQRMLERNMRALREALDRANVRRAGVS